MAVVAWYHGLLECTVQLRTAHRTQEAEPAHVLEISAGSLPPVFLRRSGTDGTTRPAGLPRPSAAEGQLLDLLHNAPGEAVRDQRGTAEDSLLHCRS